MDPIMTALLSALSSGLNNLVSEAVKDAYRTARQVIIKKLGNTKAIDALEKDPESEQNRARLAEALAANDAATDPELITLSQQILNAIEKSKTGQIPLGKYHVQTPEAPVGVIGDGARIEGGIHFYLYGGSSRPPSKTATVPPVESEAPLPPEPQPHRLAADFHPGGAVEAECPYYIQRQSDDAVLAGVGRHRGLVTLQGPSQTGKTSMMLRLYAQVRTAQVQLRPVIVDFQSLPEACFESLAAIWRSILAEVDAQLDLGAMHEPLWHASLAYDRNLTNYFDRFVFANDNTPVLICLDEVNRVFGMPVRSEFFSSVRSFYNRGAYDPTWKKLRWLLSTSSEPRFFIDDLNESPFNVGTKVPLGFFTFEETAEFIRRYGFSADMQRVERIMTCLGGRPYLVHLFLHHMALQPEKEEALLDAASAGAGVFKSHLDHYLARFQEQADLSAAMKRVIAGKGCANVCMADRLCAAGLTKEDADATIVCACELYSTYFGRRL